MPSDLQGLLVEFREQCKWGTLDGDGVIQGLKAWRQANEEDAVWATTVAGAFEAAGSDGSVVRLSDAALATALAAANVNVTRDDLLVKMPTVIGEAPTTGFTMDPVNTATGNFIEPETDLAFGQGLLAGGGRELALTRMYNSVDERVGVFGPGWSSILETGLEIDDEGARWRQADGREVYFPREGTGYGRAAGESFWLNRVTLADSKSPAPSSGEPAGRTGIELLTPVQRRILVGLGVNEVFLARDNAGHWWAFSLGGAWLGQGSGPGTAVTVIRSAVQAGDTALDEAGVVTGLVHERGRSISIEHAAGRVAVAAASDGRRVEYVYDDAGQLNTVTTTGVAAGSDAEDGSAVGARSYRWNAAGLVEAVISAAGVVEAANTYDELGRVTEQVSAHGRRVRFAYLPSRVTVVSDMDGQRSNTWVHDSSGRLLGVLDGQDQRQSMSYDPHGNQMMCTERDGAITVHAYDTLGRKTRTVTPEGADVTFGYDALDRVTTVVTADGGVVEYQYDAQDRDPSMIIDPAGGRTELVWKNGLPTQLVDPVGVTVRFTYDEHWDLVATTNGVGDTSRIIRDSAGRPVAAVSPSGARTELRYDRFGNVAARVDPDGAVWRFEYDAGNRPVAMIDPTGARTEASYGPNGEVASMTDALGRVTEQEFDDAGNLAAMVLPDGARWGFTHDVLSRLVAVIDPAGHDWVQEYDQVGELTARVDPTGVRTSMSLDRRAGTMSVSDAFTKTTYSFDKYGRPSKTETRSQNTGAQGQETTGDEPSEGPYALGESVTSVSASAELVSYDACGRPVEFVDAAGGLTRLTRDAAGNVVRMISAGGAVTRFEYDGAGRPVAMVDSSGAVTKLAYGQDQQVVERILPTGEVESFDYDACGRLVKRTAPGQGTSTYGYDPVGRVTSLRDRWHGIRRFAYNPAGELVTVTNGLGGKTRFTYDARGRVIRVTDPVGGVTEYTYTQTDQVAEVTDPLGRVTAVSYDAAGRVLSETVPNDKRPSGVSVSRWSYDRAGRVQALEVDGRLVAEIDRDRFAHRVVVTDHAQGAGCSTERVFGYSPTGQLVSVTRDGKSQAWAYDADGQRTEFTGHTGVTTFYGRDQSGHVTSVSCNSTHSDANIATNGGTAGSEQLGSAVFGYDSVGRLTTATAAGVAHRWGYRDGELGEYTANTVDDVTASQGLISGAALSLDVPGGVVSSVLIGRDEDGRVVSLLAESPGTSRTSTVFGYDEAGQLVSATTTTGGGDPVRAEWVYDLAGRLVREHTAAGTRRDYVYDAASQLLSVESTMSGGSSSVVRFAYDGLGRRVRKIGADGSWTEYDWTDANLGGTGTLAGVREFAADGTRSRDQAFGVDAFGELTGVDGVDVWWDAAASIPQLSGVGDMSVVSAPGGLTGMRGTWVSPGWRATRTTESTDPWGTPALGGTPAGVGGVAAPAEMLGAPAAGPSAVDLPSSVSLTASGGLYIGGLQWLGARAYDPGTRGFLSTDPLPPVLGAGWSGNPYSYAGNNPVGFTDPTGLSPATDADLKAYNDAHTGRIQAAGSAVGSWWKDNGEYVIAGVMVAGGIALMCTGIGGPIGGAMIAGALTSGGISVGTQKWFNNKVNWKEVGVDALIGGATGAVGGGIASGLAKQSVSNWSTNLANQQAKWLFRTATGRMMFSGGASGGVGNALSYASGEGYKKNPLGFAGSILSGVGTGSLFGPGGQKVAGKVAGQLNKFIASTPRPRIGQTFGRHMFEPNMSSVNAGTDFVFNHTFGGLQGVINEAVRPEGSLDNEDLVKSALQGLVGGAQGPLSGMHAATRG